LAIRKTRHTFIIDENTDTVIYSLDSMHGKTPNWFFVLPAQRTGCVLTVPAKVTYFSSDLHQILRLRRFIAFFRRLKSSWLCALTKPGCRSNWYYQKSKIKHISR